LKKKSEALKVWLLIIYGLLIGAAVIAVLYLLGYGAIKTTVDAVLTKISGFFGSNNTFTDILKQNWMPIAAAGATIIPSLIVAFVNNQRYKAELQARKELADIAAKQDFELSKAEAINGNAAAKIEALEKELTAYKGDTTTEQLQTRLTSVLTDNEKMSKTIEELQKQPALLAQQLWTKSGGQIIEVGGEKFKVIEKEILKVV